ncbi:DUF7344 domain-containing protein [Natronolimnohabitans innermongolicus]|uniref:DUF7344 domain-containing protein n=1 Tax=Natronolimnohabitans innermongolicus JCM 12255 TaxID=1227499 RepID=L9X6Y2_9EURY|nr:hypothetical protein [Natronolimnohabitans innermongolicus]ELY57519.1 hypothetical protein C493_08536 [Natronolimnohabitans innermongolicus JCM 12255]
MAPQPDVLQRDTVYSLLADDVREYLLWHLSVVGRATTTELADGIVTWKRRSATDATSTRSITIQLVHNHLPRLDQYDVVSYEPRIGEIETGRNFDDIEPFVDHLEPSIDLEAISD